MSDLYHPSLPYAQDRQRERTARYTMPGITRTPDRLKCVVYERMRTAKTGVDTASGFVCGMCHSLQGHPAPSREAGKIIAPTIRAGAANGGAGHGARSGDSKDELIVAHSLRGEGFDASEDGTGRGTPLVPVPHADISPAIKARDSKGVSSDGDGDGDGAILVPMRAVLQFDSTQITSPENRANPQYGDPCHPLQAKAHVPAIAFPGRMSGTQCASSEEVAPSMCSTNPTAVAFNMHKSGNEASSMGISEERIDCLRAFEKSPFAVQPAHATQVRRLTPEECEALQGFKRGYTLLPGHKADGPRYKALGNSMAVPVMAWIGRRIAEVETNLPEMAKTRRAA